MFLTAELIFVIFMLAAEKNRATFIAPLGIGLALFVAELSGMSHSFLCRAWATGCVGWSNLSNAMGDKR